MPFLLMVFLTLVCLPDVRLRGEQGWAYPEPWGFASPALSALLTWSGVFLTVAFARRIARGVTRPLAQDLALRDQLLQVYDRRRFHHQVALLAAFLLALFPFGWGWAVGEFWAWGDSVLPGAELLVLAPFLVGQVLAWACYYDVERASHRAAQRLLEMDPYARALLESQRPAFGSRAAYVLFQARQRLGLVFIPVLLLLIQKELHRLLPHGGPGWDNAVNAAGIVSLLAVFVTMPWILRVVLGLRPLPPGPVRDRLLATARRLHFRCSNILLWNTRSGMANAMVVGIVPWIRYVVFTDRLIEDFSEEEVEAVFGHEVGHVRYRHMLYYLGFLLASMLVVFIVVQFYLPPLLQAAGGTLARVGLACDGYLAVFPTVPILLSYIFVVFGFLSRRCERQADVFGCRAVSCLQADCPGHGPEAALPPRGRGLCPTGIRTFIRALEKVADVNGISRDRPGFLQSWQHSTIARRVEFLQGVLADPAVEARFQRRVALVKWALSLVLGALLAFLVYRVTGPRAADESHSRPGAPRSLTER